MYYYTIELPFYSVDVGEAMATAAGHSWELSVQVDQPEGDETQEFKIRVKGDLHIGGLMLKLVEAISESFIFHSLKGWGLLLHILSKSHYIIHTTKNDSVP